MLILDIDETLLHAVNTANEHVPYSFYSSGYSIIDGIYLVRNRPYLNEFIEYIKSRSDIEIGIWTKSTKIYATELLKELFGEEYKFRLFLVYDSCKDGIKNALILKSIEHENILFIDDRPSMISNQDLVDNLEVIPIRSWYGSDTDKELLQIIEYLKTI